MKKVISHISHGLGDHCTGRAVPGCLPRDGAPKKVTAIEVNPGMRATPKSGGDALSGHHASAIDALSGATVPEGGNRTAPGWGSGTVRSGNPTAHAPGSKNTKAVPIHPSMSRGAAHDEQLAELGRAVLAQAVRN